MRSTFSTQTVRSAPAVGEQAAAVGGLRFDWLMAALSTIFVGGLFLDGWAHNHGKVDQSFFTPWHAFFYGGFMLTGVVLVGTVIVNRWRGYDFYQAIPSGYKTTLTGLLVFGAGGMGDLLWHSIFGIEEDIEALFSPTHLMLGVGLAMVVTGPLRAAWQRRENEMNWRALGPAILSTALFISTLSFFMMFAHPITVVIAGARHRHFYTDAGVMAGMAGLIVMAALLVGPVLLILRRWRLPLGGLTLIWGINTAAMTVLDYEHEYTIGMAAAMIGAAAVLDLFQWRLAPVTARPDRLRLFAFVSPIALFGAYYATLAATEGLAWSVHLWTGSVFLTGVTGLLLSYLLAPPAVPAGVAMGTEGEA